MSNYDVIKAIVGEDRLKFNESMSKHTTFKTGGNAGAYIEPATEEELADIVGLCKNNGIRYFILGNGSDMLVSDKGYDGIIISTARLNNIYRISDCVIEAQSGILLSELSKELAKLSLKGFEFACGIPGTLGGAVVMNAGAYGPEMIDVIKDVKILERDGQIVWLSPKELDLSYRHSNIVQKQRVVLSVRIELEIGSYDEIQALMDDLTNKRVEKQPLEYPSAGSTFKRPAGYFAGKLISDAGLAGYRVGGAAVSKKHCGFIINEDNATSSDVYNLICDVQKIVKEKFGVELEREVKLLGDFE